MMLSLDESDGPALAAAIDGWLAAWTGGDPAPVLSWYHPEARYVDPARPQGLLGRDALAAYLGRLLPEYPDWVWRRRAHSRAGDWIWVAWRVEVPGAGESVVAIEGLDRLRLCEGLIIENEVCFDPSRLPAPRSRRHPVYRGPTATG